MQTVDKSSDELRQLLHDTYLKADELCKEVEKFRDQAGIPANNELRYAGYHAIVAMCGPEVLKDELVSAINHCRRAAYEASEAGILTAVEIINQFESDYRNVQVSSVVDNWIEILQSKDQIYKEISETRKNGPDQDIDHDKYMEAFRALSDHAKKLSYARDDLNKLIKAERKSGRQWMIIVLLTVLGILIAIYGIVASS